MKTTMKQHLSITLALTLVPLISQPTAAQPAQPSPTPGARGGGTPPPLQAKPEELAKIKEKTGQIDALVRLDAFLKEHGDQGQTSPDHIRFLTYEQWQLVK